MFELEIKNEEKNNEKTNNLDKLNLLKKIVECLAEIVDQAEIKVSEKGVSIQVMDIMHVALADVFLSSSMFSNYRCDRNLTIGVELKVLVKVLKGITLESNGTFRIECDDLLTNLVVQQVYPGNLLDFKLKVYSFAVDMYNIPSIEYGSEVVIPTEKFMNVPKMIASFGDRVSIKTEKNSITFEQTGGITDATLTLEECDENNNLIVSTEEPVCKEIAAKYINIVGKVAPFCDTVKIMLGEEQPVCFDFEIKGAGHMRLYVAPKIEND